MKLAGAYIPNDKHAALTQLAKSNHRTLADQLRCLFDRALTGDLEPKQPKPRKKKEEAKA